VFKLLGESEVLKDSEKISKLQHSANVEIFIILIITVGVYLFDFLYLKRRAV
jgi:hypothetical protein